MTSQFSNPSKLLADSQQNPFFFCKAYSFFCQSLLHQCYNPLAPESQVLGFKVCHHVWLWNEILVFAVLGQQSQLFTVLFQHVDSYLFFLKEHFKIQSIFLMSVLSLLPDFIGDISDLWVTSTYIISSHSIFENLKLASLCPIFLLGQNLYYFVCFIFLLVRVHF